MSNSFKVDLFDYVGVVYISAMVQGSELDKAIRALKAEMEYAEQFTAYLQQFSGEQMQWEGISFKAFTGKIDDVWVNGEHRLPTDT